MRQIRQMLEHEREEYSRLSSFAFQYTLTPEELAKRSAALVPSENWGCYGEEGMEAKLMLLPMEIFVGGKPLAMGGIAGVATWPEKRRGGRVAELLTHTLRVMKEQGQTVSVLHPFKFEFYRRFGWETNTEYKKYELAAHQLPRFPAASGRIKRTVDLEVLAPVYEAYAARHNGMVVRTRKWWEERVLARKNQGGLGAVYCDQDGHAKGYMLYKVADYIFTIQEWVSLDGEAYRGLWNFVADHDSMLGSQGKVLLKMAHREDRLASLLKDPRISQETVPYSMARLVDAEAFLKGYAFRPGASGELKLHIRDEHAPWNEGSYTVLTEEQGSGPKVWRGPAGGETAEAEGLSCGIGILTSMLLGYERPSFWYEHGLLTGSTSQLELLEAALPDGQPFLLDFF